MAQPSNLPNSEPELNISEARPGKIIRNVSGRVYANSIYELPPNVCIRVDDEEAERLLEDFPSDFEVMEEGEECFDLRGIISGYRHRAILQPGLQGLLSVSKAFEEGRLGADGKTILPSTPPVIQIGEGPSAVSSVPMRLPKEEKKDEAEAEVYVETD